MPLFAGLLTTLISALASFFSLIVAKNLAIGLAAASVYAAVTIATMSGIAFSINTAITYIAGLSMPAPVHMGFSFFMPTNFAVCVALIVTAETAVALKRWTVQELSFLSGSH